MYSFTTTGTFKGVNLERVISTGDRLTYDSSGIFEFAADKSLAWGSNNYSGTSTIYSYSFLNGKFTAMTASFSTGSRVPFGKYNSKAIFYDGLCSIYLTGDYFE